MKKALITGITGQDGSYLAEFLLEKGYEVHGITRRISISNTQRIDHLLAANKIKIHDGDLSDGNSIVRIINEVQPDEIYNLAAQSHVGNSFDVPIYTGDVDALGVLRILDAVHQLGLDKKTRIYQASTSELYGQVEEVPQNENTPFHPFSPYAVAKQYGFWMMREYRDAYGQFAAMVFFLTMSRSVVGRLLLQEKSHWQQHVFPRDFRSVYILAILIPSEIGDMQRIM